MFIFLNLDKCDKYPYQQIIAEQYGKRKANWLFRICESFCNYLKGKVDKCCDQWMEMNVETYSIRCAHCDRIRWQKRNPTVIILKCKKCGKEIKYDLFQTSPSEA